MNVRGPETSSRYREWLELTVWLAADIGGIICLECGEACDTRVAIDSNVARMKDSPLVGRLTISFYCPPCHTLRCAEKNTTITLLA